MNKKTIILLAAIIVVATVLVLLSYKLYFTNKSTQPTFLQRENNLQVFSSPTLSFNFTDDFSLVNASGLLAPSNYNSAVIYYNLNSSLVINVIQNESNETFDYDYSLLKSEFSMTNYSYTNISTNGYSGVEVISKYPSISYGIVLIAGPSGYYTAIYITNPYSAFIGTVNNLLNTVMKTIRFAPSPFI